MSLNGSETLQVQGQDATGRPSGETFQTTTSAIAALAAATVLPPIVNTNITTAGAGTLTAAAIVGGLITRSGPVAAFSDATDTAVAIVAALAAYVANESAILRIKNTTAFAQTITAGSGVTLSGNVIIPANSVGEYLVTITSATAVTMLHIDTVARTTENPEVITVLSTVGAGTITGAGIAGGVTSRTGSQSGTPFTDTTDTAANIVSATPNIHIGDSFEYVYQNTTNAVATITGGSGVTVSGITDISAGSSARYLLTYTALNTFTMVGFSGGQSTATSQQNVTLAGSTSGLTLLKATATASGTLTLPAATDTVAVLGTAQTFTAAQTFTNSDLKLLGSSTGANTFTALNSSATNYTSSVPAVTGVLASTSGANLYINDLKKCTATVTSSSTTLANVTGLSFTVVPGTYKFRCVLQGVADGTGGIKYAFNYTTTSLTSIQATAQGATAAAIATQSTTSTTTQALLFDQAAAVLQVVIEGSMVVATGGTIDVQVAQHAANASSTTVLGSTAEFIRIA